MSFCSSEVEHILNKYHVITALLCVSLCICSTDTGLPESVVCSKVLETASQAHHVLYCVHMNDELLIRTMVALIL